MLVGGERDGDASWAGRGGGRGGHTLAVIGSSPASARAPSRQGIHGSHVESGGKRGNSFDDSAPIAELYGLQSVRMKVGSYRCYEVGTLSTRWRRRGPAGGRRESEMLLLLSGVSFVASGLAGSTRSAPIARKTRTCHTEYTTRALDRGQRWLSCRCDYHQHTTVTRSLHHVLWLLHQMGEVARYAINNGQEGEYSIVLLVVEHPYIVKTNPPASQERNIPMEPQCASIQWYVSGGPSLAPGKARRNVRSCKHFEVG